MKLSIVIPCCNCSKTIGRLLDSILANNLAKDEYEVIIVDDKSTDNFLDIVKTYEDKMNFVYLETVRDVHCPGNTRQVALEHIKGDWFTFIDNDDMFEPDAFHVVFNYIEKHEVKYTLCTFFREYFYDTKEYGRVFENADTDTWLHGKYFNRANTLEKFHCRFKDDLMSHEDVYFNSNNLANLISIGEDYVYFPHYTYRWIENPQSLSRSYFSEKNYYIDTYLNDFFIGASYPFFDMFTKEGATDDQKGFALNQIMMTLLHGYFYYQAHLWRLGSNDTLTVSYDAVRDLKRKMVRELHVTDIDIINYIYGLPERYHSVKSKSIWGTCPFIEIQSFRDFILNL